MERRNKSDNNNKKVTLKKEKKLKMTRHKNRLPKRRLVLPKNDYKEGNVLVQILNEEHKKHDTMTRQKNKPNEIVLFKRFFAFLLDSKMLKI